jgi:hypothetical protein
MFLMSAVIYVVSLKRIYVTAAIFRERDRMANITKLFHTHIFVVLHDCAYVYAGRELYKSYKRQRH